MSPVPKQKAIDILTSLMKETSSLATKGDSSVEFKTWRNNVRVAIRNIYGDRHEHLENFDDIDYSLMAFTDSTPDYVFHEAYVDGLKSGQALLKSMINEIQIYREDSISSDKKPTEHEDESTPASRDIFLVHGHDSGSKETVARFLSSLELTPIILHEQPSKGLTIIEKFEQYSNVNFAVVLLTPDDEGKAIHPKDTSLRPRARQNVIFEFGYFIGKLGRENVCGLHKGNIELPSDYSGVIYIPLDEDDSWKLKLVKELKAAGFDVDANKIL